MPFQEMSDISEKGLDNVKLFLIWDMNEGNITITLLIYIPTNIHIYV